METIEIARRMAQLGAAEEALRAYALVLHADAAPEELLEAAAYTLQNGGDYKVAYTTFVALHRAGHFREETLGVMTEAFYEPNIGPMKNRYERNCKLLAKYPYLFRKDFLPFDRLPLRFCPYDDDSYVPFDVRTGEFRDFVNVRDPIVSRNFFKDLEKPVFASDVYSQYELEYLNDNVRPSEWCARENHIYLHYTDWTEFCCWLQVLNLGQLIKSRKVVFLIGDEREEYPIDFKKRFGLDYRGYRPRPIGIREVNRLIWHTQLSNHNGGDFFNEVFDEHPNLFVISSVLLDDLEEAMAGKREEVKKYRGRGASLIYEDNAGGRALKKLLTLDNPTDKDILVTIYMGADRYGKETDPTSRIAPALFFQPHFTNLDYALETDGNGNAVLDSDQAEKLRDCSWLREFKYIKTFTPIRRPTTSHGGAVRFMLSKAGRQVETDANGEEHTEYFVVPDAVMQRVLNRSYLRDPDDRMYHDAVIVRFEDGKLNPEATFARLAAFLDLPYTESMTYCSDAGVRDPEQIAGNARGFDPAPVYRTYDEYVNDNERRFIEFFLRDAYETYGYDFQAYGGEEVDLERVKQWIAGFDVINGYMRKTMWDVSYHDAPVTVRTADNGAEADGEARQKAAEMVRRKMLDQYMAGVDALRVETASTLLRGLRFINRRGQPLEMTPLLEPDPALLKAPLYH